MNDTQLFAFESDFVATLRCVPMAVRFKLDRCGIKLSLRQWSRFSRGAARCVNDGTREVMAAYAPDGSRGMPYSRFHATSMPSSAHHWSSRMLMSGEVPFFIRSSTS